MLYAFFWFICWTLIVLGLGLLVVAGAARVQAFDAQDFLHVTQLRLLVGSLFGGLFCLWFGILGLVILDIHQKKE